MPQFAERLFYTASWQTMNKIVAVTPGLTAPRLYHLTVDEYHRMIEAEVFPPKARIELIEGALYEMPPVFRPHQIGIMYLTRAFGALAPQGRLLVQLPFILSNASEPEPDLGILAAGTPLDKPTVDQLVLAVEVSYSSVRFDLRRKAPLYQRAGHFDTWVIDIPGQRVVVFPREGGSTIYPRGQGTRLTPRHAEEISLDVDDLFAAIGNT
jgi:Uma2 family endonuclease